MVPTREFLTEHIIAATGYKVDMERLAFLDSEIRSKLNSVNWDTGVVVQFRVVRSRPLFHRACGGEQLRTGDALRFRGWFRCKTLDPGHVDITRTESGLCCDFQRRDHHGMSGLGNFLCAGPRLDQALDAAGDRIFRLALVTPRP